MTSLFLELLVTYTTVPLKALYDLDIHLLLLQNFSVVSLWSNFWNFCIRNNGGTCQNWRYFTYYWSETYLNWYRCESSMRIFKWKITWNYNDSLLRWIILIRNMSPNDNGRFAKLLLRLPGNKSWHALSQGCIFFRIIPNPCPNTAKKNSALLL